MSVLCFRHRSAPYRNRPSRACRSLLPLLGEKDTILDYGCGKGFDTEYLGWLGFETLGYDPYFPGKDKKRPADWVLLFYVINVIEDLAEREAVLLDAYRLAKKGLAVGVTPKERLTGHERPYADGRLTTINTFFTSYDWNRAKRYIRAVLGLQPILKDAVLWAPAGIGEPIAHYQLSPSQLRERIRDYEDQIQDLISTTLDDHGRCPMWAEDCTLQPYQTRGVRRYRVFSDSGQADGKRYLYAGTGEPWGWVMDRFVNRDKLAILQDRLEYVRGIRK